VKREAVKKPKKGEEPAEAAPAQETPTS